MRFEYENFKCDADIFNNDNDIIVRFYNKSKEQREDEIVNLVIVDPGYGYLHLKFKGDTGLLSGYLDENVFFSDELVNAAINFVEGLWPLSGGAYIPYHVARVKLTSYVEYNGEF